MADNSGIKLFEHNKTAYNSAVKMLNETGKAAVIHPTGTGKSFIAFKLCEDNKDKKYAGSRPANIFLKRNVKTFRQQVLPCRVTLLFSLMPSLCLCRTASFRK